MKFFIYLLCCTAHLTTGCVLSAYDPLEIFKSLDESVLLPCSCTDPQATPEGVKWETTSRTASTKAQWSSLSNVIDKYGHRIQMFNKYSSGNLSLLLTELTKEDQGTYVCGNGMKNRFIRLFVTGQTRAQRQERKRQIAQTTAPQEENTSPTVHTSHSKTQDSESAYVNLGQNSTSGPVQDSPLYCSLAYRLLHWTLSTVMLRDKLHTASRLEFMSILNPYRIHTYSSVSNPAPFKMILTLLYTRKCTSDYQSSTPEIM
ncbi:uncharacterized protein LOC114779040 isoform X3 [Denticeps clupeoides]|uniref:uncharacterized protein LOC114779040 isoform X3 n=1 Tax=Denticeps clupeoides TaxID=299321 RepID=UPI0010A43B77|nr:uncharacterized protein LOC114779040 isoform X3 [Denticeps clupeoides]